MNDYASQCASRLRQKGFSPEQEWKQRKLVSVSENGKTYKVPVANGIESAVFQIDGEVIKAGQKCDKLLLAQQADTAITL